MEYFIFSWWDYVLLVAMCSLSTVIGIYYGCFGSKQSTTADYVFGGGKMNIFPVSMSLITNGLSGVSLLGIPAETYIHGTQYSITVLSVIATGLITHVVYLPVFYKLKLSSTYEYLQIRFDEKVRTLASILYILMAVLESPMIIYAPSLAFNQMSGINLYAIAFIASLICIFYTTIGGFKAVIWTDTLQLTVTLFTLFTILIIGIITVGGFGNIWKTAELGERIEFFNMDPNPTLRASFWSIFLGQIFFWINYAGINPAAVQRFVAVPNFSDAKKVLLIFTIGTVITKSVNCFMGLLMYAEYYACDPLSAGLINTADQISPYYVLDLVHTIPGISGLFIACLFSVGFSAFSTRLNVLSGTIFADYIAPFMSVQTATKRGSFIMKVVTVIIGILSVLLIFLVERLGTMVEFMITISGIVSGVLIGLFTMGMLCPVANSKGAFYGGLLSLVLIFWIGIKRQILIWSGLLTYTPKRLDTYGCNATTLLNSTITPSNIPTDESTWLFRITFHYYGLIGALSTIVIGVLISWPTRTNRQKDPELFSPIVHRFLPPPARRLRSHSAQHALYRFNIIKNNRENENSEL